MTDRDRQIINLLKKFRIMSRDQIAQLICPEVANPTATVNRILKRLSRDLHITQIPRPKDQCYWYMPNPTIIHPESQNCRHFLGIVDLYISLGKPEVFYVEPVCSSDYRPDVYCRVEHPLVIEYQRSKITIKSMQEKINNFAKAYTRGEHDAKTLWIMSDITYNVKTPEGFKVIQSNVWGKEKGA